MLGLFSMPVKKIVMFYIKSGMWKQIEGVIPVEESYQRRNTRSKITNFVLLLTTTASVMLYKVQIIFSLGECCLISKTKKKIEGCHTLTNF